MKRKILTSAVVAGMLLGNTAFADFSTMIDRKFDENRTVYYIEVSSSKIPDISTEGYTVVREATKPYEGGALTNENTTVLKKNDTGKEYRFVFEKKSGSVSVTDANISEEGVLKITGSIDGLESIEILLLKPTEAFSEDAFTYADVDESKMEEKVLKAVKVDAADVKNKTLLTYTFPEEADCGEYGILITGKGIDENYYTTKTYISKTIVEGLLKSVNEKSQFNETNTVAGLRDFVEKNARGLSLDTTYYNKLSQEKDGGRDIAVSLMKSAGDYKDLTDVAEAFYKGVVVGAAYDGAGLNEALAQYNDSYMKLEMYDEYKALTDTATVVNSLKGVKDEATLRTRFNELATVQLINESDPEGIAKVLDSYMAYLPLEEAAKTNYVANREACIAALGNKGFADGAAVNLAIKNAKSDDGGVETPTTNKGSWSNVGKVAPVTSTPVVTPEPDEPIFNNNLPFDDIYGVKWAYTAIEHLYNNKILSGKSATKFAPNDYIRREEFTKLIVNGFALEGVKNLTFKDVHEGSWYEYFVKIAFANGVVTGMSEDTFGVGRNITREDIAVMIYRAVEASGMNTEILIDDTVELTDLDTVSDYAKKAVEFMISKGAISGIDGKFMPKKLATRAETAKMLYQIVKIR